MPHSSRGLQAADSSRDLVMRAPGPALRGQVLGYRGFRFGRRAPRRRLLVPDGLVKVMIGFGRPLRTTDAVDPRRSASAPSLVCGLRTTATVGSHAGGLDGVTVLLTPIAAHRIFGVPMSELGGQDLDPVELLGPWARRLVERLAECPGWESRFALLDAALADRLHEGPAYSPEVMGAWRELRRTSGRTPVARLAAEAGWSRRQLERRFLAQVGLPPKQVAQVARLQRALRLRRSGSPWSAVAAEAGYHDQPHFNRHFTSMVGCPPGRFWSARGQSRPGDPLDFLPDHVTSVLLES